jgi:23S rRNA pseudouridine1911/1915/1917 synthase
MNLEQLRGKSYGVEHLLASDSGPLVEVLANQMPLSLAQIQFLLSFGSIYVKGQRCLENTQIRSGAYVRVHQNPRRFPIEQFSWPEQKVFEDEGVIVINKPSGLPVHPTVDNIKENLASLIEAAIGHQVFVTHRLDVATSGLMIFAKTKSEQTRINNCLMNGEIRKFYRARVHGVNVPLGEMTHYMEPSPRAPKTVSAIERPGWQVCRLKVIDQIQTDEDQCEILIELITGRTHQIRAQLAASGFPIIGDRAYGSRVQLSKFENICLQAYFLEFPLSPNEKKSFRLAHAPWQKPLPMI